MRKPTGMTGGKKRKESKIWSLKDADSRFSNYIKERDNFTCKRCGKIFDSYDGLSMKNLTCSHFWARQHKGTRFDSKNCISLCWMPCHKYHFEKEKQGDYREFMLTWLGKTEYKELEKRARGVYPQTRAIMDCMELLGVVY